MLDLEDLTLDPTRAQEGEWVDFRGGSKLLIASTDSPKYKGAMASLARRHKLDLDDENPEFADLIQDLTCEALSTTVLLSWEGINMGGKALAYSQAVAKEVLLHAPAIRAFVEEYAGRTSNFNMKAVEKAKKS